MRNNDENIYNALVKKGLDFYENNEIEKSILYLTIGLKGYNRNKEDYNILKSKLKDITKIYASLINNENDNENKNDNEKLKEYLNKSKCESVFNQNDLKNSSNIIEFIKNELKQKSYENDLDKNESY